MQNTRETAPWIAAACALVLGFAGMATGIIVQLPTTPAAASSAETSGAPQARAAQSGVVKTVAAKPGALDVAKVKTVAVQASARDVKSSTARTVVSYASTSQRRE